MPEVRTPRREEVTMIDKIMKKCKPCRGTGKLTGKMVQGTGKKSIQCPWCHGKGFVFKSPNK